MTRTVGVLRGLILGAGLAATPGVLRASPVQASVEATTDSRVRGLSWSDGKASIEGLLSVSIAGDLSVVIGATSLRQSPRHNGADVAVDAAVRYGRQVDAIDLWIDLRGQGFLGERSPGTAGEDYWTMRAGAGYSLGPARLGGHLAWAPPQSAIGGSNLYVNARLSAGIPGTPWTLAVAAGHSSGVTNDPIRAARLRPGGNYSDFRFDADYIGERVFAGISVTATTIDNDIPFRGVQDEFAGNFAPRALLRAGFRF